MPYVKNINSVINTASYHRSFSPRLMLFILCVICLLIFYACVTPQAVLMESNTSFKKYKKVYLLVPEKDPRNVFPIVASKLTELGFEVKAIKHNDSLIGDQGSGFLVSNGGHILTVEHLLTKQQNATVWIKGNRMETEVVCRDVEKDLALLKTKTPIDTSVEPLQIYFDYNFKMGQDVYTIGFPLSGILGRSPRLTKGLISSTVGMKDSPDSLQVSAEVQPGNSGGPLLNENGNVIGVVQSTLNPMAVWQRTGGSLPQNVNFAVKAYVIESFFDKCAFSVPLVSKKLVSHSFDKVSNAVAQVYSGIVSNEFVTEPKLVCIVYYDSIWDIWFRFRVFHIALYDYDTGALLLKAGQYRDNLVNSQGATIDKTFEEIKNKISQDK